MLYLAAFIQTVTVMTDPGCLHYLVMCLLDNITKQITLYTCKVAKSIVDGRIFDYNGNVSLLNYNNPKLKCMILNQTY